MDVVERSTDTLDLNATDMEIDEFVGSFSIADDLDDVFDDLLNHRFPDSLTGDRRLSVVAYVQSFANVYSCLSVSYPNGINWLMCISYFITYNFLCMLNRHRGGFLDDDLIRRNVVMLLNECANGDFNLLYELIFD